ncbi:MAG: 1,4-alpha-glucan branching protein GlgB [Dissulfurispiraceae bacterium]|nr:1,4-alpha-glucan branching protein GlgB [Dissulfurispiraceae bacterium]
MDRAKLMKQIVRAECSNPFDILGPHAEDRGVVVRAFLPEAKEAWLIHDDKSESKSSVNTVTATSMRKTGDNGFFELKLGQGAKDFRYKIRVLTHWDEIRESFDPYCFPATITEFDQHLLSEGTHYNSYEKLGAHIIEIDGVSGVRFSVWAPNANRVSVIGEFNGWDSRRHQMRMLSSAGIWELFIPGLCQGCLYKFDIKSRYNNHIQQKADPFAFHFEVRPKSAAVVYDINNYRWEDEDWIKNRAQTDWLRSPISVYEVHLGSWMRAVEDGNRFLTYSELAVNLIPYVKKLGYTHIELLPVSEHPFDGSWGYQTIGYYAPTSRFGTPDDFMRFVDMCHKEGIGVIVDWVPAHFPKDGHGLAFFDGTHLYEHMDPKMSEHKDWGTLIFNYGRNEVRNFLISNALFWIEKYHIDGLRVDAVASMLYLDYSKGPGEWVPNKYGGNENIEAVQFIKTFNEVVHQRHPGVLTIAEESTAWPSVSRPTYIGGLGFSLKWNMGWMHDTLSFFSKDPVFRKYHSGELTFSMLYAFTENFVLPFSHDEVVHGKRSMIDKMPGDIWQKFANLRALYGYMYAHPGKKLLFMGAEFGQWHEWNHDEGLHWHLLGNEPHAGLLSYVRDLNNLYKNESAMHRIDFDWHGFQWIDFRDSENSVLSFIRRSENQDDFLVFVFNLTPVPRYDYRVGVPRVGYYREILNSDSSAYWGGNMGNAGGVAATEHASHHGFSHSISITLPPLSCLVFKA